MTRILRMRLHLTTRYRLMGVDVASFGDFFADMRPVDAQSRAVSRVIKTPVSGESNPKTLDHTTEVTAQPAVHILIDDSTNNTNGSAPQAKSIPLKKRGQKHDQPIKSLVYKDPFDSTYKKYIFTADGKYLLGGMMIGDVADYVKLVAIVKKKVWTPFYQVLLIHLPDFVSQKAIEVAPSQFIVGAKKSGDDAGDDLDDDAQVCSCHVSFFVYFFFFGRLMALIFMVERLKGANWSMHQGRGMYHHWRLESENQSWDRVRWLHAIGKLHIFPGPQHT